MKYHSARVLRESSGRRRAVSSIIAVALAGTMGALAQAPAANAAEPLITDPLPYVHTMSGTQGSTNNFGGAAMPFGMVQFSPDTVSGNAQSTTGPSGPGYRYNNLMLHGFGMTHASQGCGMGGDFPLLPTSYNNITGTGNNGMWAQKLALNKTTDPDVGTPGYYSLRGRDTSTMSGTTAAGIYINSELSATTRAGIAKFNFPAGTVAPKAVLKTDQTAWSTSSYNSEVHVDPATGIVTARANVGNFCRKSERHDLFYALKFEQPWTSFGTWVNAAAPVVGRTDVSTTSNNRTGAYFTFADGTELITARMAISYTSVDHAIMNLKEEMYGGSFANAPRAFDDVVTANKAAWNDILSRVQISGPVAGQTDARQRTFYSMLYRSFTHPATMDDVNGDYLGFEYPPQVHNVSEHPGAGGRQRHQYTMISDWDIYRNLTPFQAQMVPDITSDQMQSLVNAAEQMGHFPQWTVANSSTNQMNGDNTAPMLGFAWEYGARDWDYNKAIDITIENTTGAKTGKFTGGNNRWQVGMASTTAIPEPNTRWPMMQRPGGDFYNEYKYAPQVRPFQIDHMVGGGSHTLEYVVDDFSIAQIAKDVGRLDVAEEFYDRAHWWANLWNPTADSIQPRDINGRYPETSQRSQFPATFGYRGNCYDLGQQGWEEGYGEQYLWLVPNDLHSLGVALGGWDKALERLNTFFSNGYVRGASRPEMNLDNQPNFNTGWVFTYWGRPDRTAQVIDDMTQSLFSINPAGGEPGNDDLGALANWYVNGALGMFPQNSGTSIMTLNTPTFDKMVMTTGHGHVLTVNAEGAQAGRQYNATPAGSGYRYINALSINGVPTTKSWFDFKLLENANLTLDMTIGTTPNAWGTLPADVPPSFSDGVKPLALNVNTVSTPTFGATHLVPGATGTATVDVQRIGAKGAGFTVNVETSHAGIVAAPVAAQTFDAFGKASFPISLTVDPFLADGYYEMTVTLTADGTAVSEKGILRVLKADGLETRKTVIGTGHWLALNGSFDGANGVTWSGGTGTNMGNNTTTNLYDRLELEKVGLAPGAAKNFTADGKNLQVIWPNAPIGYANAYQPVANQTIVLERPTAKFSLVGAAYTGTTNLSTTLTLSNGTDTQTVAYPVAFSNWVLPSTTGNVQNGTLAPQYNNSVITWTPHRLAPETATDPGAYVFATQPYEAPAGWQVVSITFPAVGTGQRIFAVAGDVPALSATWANHPALAGDVVTVTGSGFAANEPVTVAINTEPFEASSVLTANGFGEISGTVTIPVKTFSTGAHEITARAASLPDDAVTPVPIDISVAHNDGWGAALQAVVNFYAAVYEANSARFTPESFAPLADALTDARWWIAKGMVAEVVYHASVADLAAAAEGLNPVVDFSALDGAIVIGDTVVANRTHYVSVNIPALEAALAAAKTVRGDAAATQAAVDAAFATLMAAITNVVEKGDTSGLASLVQVVKAMDSSRFTPTSWGRVASALAVAEGILAQAEPRFDHVDDAFGLLADAMSALVLQAAKAGLKSAIDVADSIMATADLYVAASIATLPAFLAAAKAVYANGDATAAEVTTAQSDLILAIAAARLKATGSPIAPASVFAAAAADPAAAAALLSGKTSALKAFVKAPAPKIVGIAKAGKTLKAKVAKWSPKAKVSFQWYRNGVKIAHATKASYKVKAADKGAKLTVKATGKKAGFAAKTKASKAKAVK
ncbi:MAG: GH92 family glycosyl hydrolase [Micrococcales bacterium]|nr:GH92 family glycosyl hydrolase [Micrococcales bacterium]